MPILFVLASNSDISSGPVKPKLVARGSPSSAWKKTKAIPTVAASDVPKGLRSLFDCILWQLYENESIQALTNPLILVTEDLEICTVAKKLKIPMKAIADFRQDMIKRKDVELDRNVLGDLEVDFGIREVAEDIAINGDGEVLGGDISYDEEYTEEEQNMMPEEKDDVKMEKSTEVVKAVEETVEDVKQDDSLSVLSNERQWTAYKANEFAAKNGLEPNDSLPKVTPAAQLQSNLSAWNNFRITAAKQDKEDSRKAAEEHAAKLAEEARTGVKQEPHVPVFNETWRQVKVDNGMGKREVVGIATTTKCPQEHVKGLSDPVDTKDTDVKQAGTAKDDVIEVPSKTKATKAVGKDEKSDTESKDSSDSHVSDVKNGGRINGTVRLAQRPSREASPTPKKPSPLREELSSQTTPGLEANGMVIHIRDSSGQASPRAKKSSPLREGFPAETTIEHNLVSSEVVIPSAVKDAIIPDDAPASSATALTIQKPKQLPEPEIDSDEEVVVFDPKAKRLSTQRRSQRPSPRPMTPVEKPQALEKFQIVKTSKVISQDSIVSAAPSMNHVHTPHAATILSNPQGSNHMHIANISQHRQVSAPIQPQPSPQAHMNQSPQAHPNQGAQQAQYASYGRNTGRHHNSNTPHVANGGRYLHHTNHQQGRPVSSHSPTVIDPDSFGRSTFVNSKAHNANGHHRHVSPRAGSRSTAVTPEPDVDFVLKTGSPRSATRGKGTLWVPS